mmetsp:Transcript_56851/g.94061  ORF Transcript_56851/g.94061 Transcript_56851/m.94061 type:complete len:101 (-) Transcript_56851:640-942(-)
MSQELKCSQPQRQVMGVLIGRREVEKGGGSVEFVGNAHERVGVEPNRKEQRSGSWPADEVHVAADDARCKLDGTMLTNGVVHEGVAAIEHARALIMPASC